jgi:hypothetical protein
MHPYSSVNPRRPRMTEILDKLGKLKQRLEDKFLGRSRHPTGERCRIGLISLSACCFRTLSTVSATGKTG